MFFVVSAKDSKLLSLLVLQASAPIYRRVSAVTVDETKDNEHNDVSALSIGYFLMRSYV